MSIALIPSTTSWNNYINLSKLLIKKNQKVIFLITNNHVKKLKKNIPKQITVIEIIEPNKELLLEIKNQRIYIYILYFILFLKNYLKSLIFIKLLSIKKIITVGDRENGTVLSILKNAKKNNVKIFIYHAGGISGKNMLVLSRKMYECFDVTYNKWFIGRYKNQCNYYKNKKIYSFYHPILTKIFDRLNILPKNPWVMGSGNSDVILVESNFVKKLYKKSNLKKKLLVIGSSQVDNINKSFKFNKSLLTNKKNLKTKSINIGFMPNIWFEHNLLSKYNAMKRNSLLCKILKDSVVQKNVNILVFLHPKQKIKNYRWIEKKYKFKLISENISHYMSYLDCLYIGFSSTIIYWASDLNIRVIIANIFPEKNAVFKKFKNVNYLNSITKIKSHLKTLKKNKKKTNIYKNIDFKKNIFSLFME